MTLDFLQEYGFFAGVPDSQLQPLCNYLMKTYGIGRDHLIAANEGGCVAVAAGYHLATGEIPVVYLQNSGLGNIVNPVVSLLNDRVYGIPMIFIVGWRGEPGVHDEPQHIYQGEVTLKLLADMDIASFVIGKDTNEQQLTDWLHASGDLLKSGKSIALVVKKGALAFAEKVCYENAYALPREEIIRRIARAAGEDVIVSTTGKASRELFEIREQMGQGHELDFLTVGSMGHASSIALGIALQKPKMRIWCVDGDGAALMHMGAMALIGQNKPENLVHLVLNNAAHETVGGMPTVAGGLDWPMIAKACGYEKAVSVASFPALDVVLERAKTEKGAVFIEVKTALGSREDLGRPTTTAKENKEAFMRYLKTLK